MKVYALVYASNGAPCGTSWKDYTVAESKMDLQDGGTYPIIDFSLSELHKNWRACINNEMYFIYEFEI